MNEVVFISDLHLHPEDKKIQNRFDAFIEWAKVSTKQVYILGDFFHAWVGDDAIDEWSLGIAKQLYSLKTLGIPVFYMHGNRDFLLGKRYASLAGWEMLPDPTVIKLGSDTILLAHGDGYCTKDISHQRFRKLTRNRLFSRLFLKLSLKIRKKIALKMRARSKRYNEGRDLEKMDVVTDSFIQDMVSHKASILIHGHTHKPGCHYYDYKDKKLIRYVLSDWDDTPQILSYNGAKGLYFVYL